MLDEPADCRHGYPIQGSYTDLLRSPIIPFSCWFPGALSSWATAAPWAAEWNRTTVSGNRIKPVWLRRPGIEPGCLAYETRRITIPSTRSKKQKLTQVCFFLAIVGRVRLARRLHRTTLSSPETNGGLAYRACAKIFVPPYDNSQEKTKTISTTTTILYTEMIESQPLYEKWSLALELNQF